jgi:CRP/FNR family transcriptional regulator, transcriptional activator FtrB
MPLNPIDSGRACSIPLFKALSDRSLSALANFASVRHFPRGVVLFREGERANSLQTLMSGSIELFSEQDDRRTTISVVHAAKPIMLTSIAHDLNPISGRTLEPIELLSIPLKLIHELIEIDPNFARAIAYQVAGELRDVIEDFKNQRMRTSIERLAEWILRSDEDAGGKGWFVLPYGKRILASQLGMAPENLSRNLAALAPFGVTVCRREISLSDRRALAELARLPIHLNGPALACS